MRMSGTVGTLRYMIIVVWAIWAGWVVWAAFCFIDTEVALLGDCSDTVAWVKMKKVVVDGSVLVHACTLRAPEGSIKRLHLSRDQSEVSKGGGGQANLGNARIFKGFWTATPPHWCMFTLKAPDWSQQTNLSRDQSEVSEVSSRGGARHHQFYISGSYNVSLSVQWHKQRDREMPRGNEPPPRRNLSLCICCYALCFCFPPKWWPHLMEYIASHFSSIYFKPFLAWLMVDKIALVPARRRAF